MTQPKKPLVIYFTRFEVQIYPNLTIRTDPMMITISRIMHN